MSFMKNESFDVEKSAMELVMNDNMVKKRQLAKKIFNMAYEKRVFPSSTHEFYMARGRGEFGGFTVPAINLRSMTYDLARAIFTMYAVGCITDNSVAPMKSTVSGVSGSASATKSARSRNLSLSFAP